MTDNLEYKIVEIERRPDETEAKSAERALNFHAQASWEFDSFFDAAEPPPTRYLVLRRRRSN